MSEAADLLELAKSAATTAGRRLREGSNGNVRAFVYTHDNPREIKALADRMLEDDILAALAGTGIPVLSEESGHIEGRESLDRLFVVDPLDGTFNFVKGLGPSAVSIALWQQDSPVFGVIFDVGTGALAWGGSGMGSYLDGQRLSVSSTAAEQHAALCTGFPARREISREVGESFIRRASRYGKIRMLGSAAMSLLLVARGAADAYCEQGIMHWDVAAGLAVLEGAGGRIRYQPTGVPHMLDVFATNGVLPLPF